MIAQKLNQVQEQLHSDSHTYSPSKLPSSLDQPQSLKHKLDSTDVPSLVSNHTQLERNMSNEKEINKKIVDHKLKYKKLKQKLTTLSQQIQDQGMIKDQKDLTSPNKSRLMKLSLQLEKAIKTQAIDYPSVESLLRQIQKIVEHKREHDVLILRGARTMNTLLYFIKRFPSLHKTEATQSMQAMEQTLKLLHIILALSSSREQILASNQLISLISLLSCALMREDRKLSIGCMYLLNLVIASPIKIQLQPLLHANIEYILCSSLIKRLKSYIENCVYEDDPVYCQLLLIGFRFFYLLSSISCAKQLQRPIYKPLENSSILTKSICSYFELGIQLMISSMNDLLFQKFNEEDTYILRDEEIANYKINILLYIFKTLNIIFHVDYVMTQKNIEFTKNVANCLNFIFEYSKQNFKENYELKNLCSQIIIFLGNLTFENQGHQQMIRKYGLLQALCNHPIDYLMEPNLKNILFPSFCCIVFKNTQNLKEAFAENSPQLMLQYLLKQIKVRRQRVIEQEPMIELALNVGKPTQCKTLSRKTSVSSINSKTSMAESLSTQASNPLCIGVYRYNHLQQKFRPQNWQQLTNILRTIDD